MSTALNFVGGLPVTSQLARQTSTKCASKAMFSKHVVVVSQRATLVMHAAPSPQDDEPDFGQVPTKSSSIDLENLDPERKKKLEEIARLRAAEKFIEVDEGRFECRVCEYVYEPTKGEMLAGVPPGTKWEDVPESFQCPSCKSDKSAFKSIKKVIAGFAENQTYGFGANTWTEAQKSGVIFGALAAFFLLFLSGYFLN
mmetsp:Transcript_21235/g.36496  ORF Transcript_21235/g.36496 Transcript_21235/m.36496 type:complete len:198 (-) Transcript_21235:348-941(-)